jgi:two-component system sensor histidine kinase BaeS
VIGNLLENALRYTAAPGEVALRLRRDGDTARLTVSDSAPAPDAAAIPRLFDRFYRGDASRGRASGGSGLGLSICKTIALAHGGAITAAPSALGGLEMTLELPMTRKTL